MADQLPPSTASTSSTRPPGGALDRDRVAAHTLDGLIVLMALLLVLLTVAEYTGSFDGASAPWFYGMWALRGVVTVLILLQVVCLAMWSRTVGMRRRRLMWVAHSTGKAAYGRAVAKWLAQMIPAVASGGMLTLLIALLSMDDAGRTAFDRMCGTRTISVDEAAAAPVAPRQPSASVDSPQAGAPFGASAPSTGVSDRVASPVATPSVEPATPIRRIGGQEQSDAQVNADAQANASGHESAGGQTSADGHKSAGAQKTTEPTPAEGREQGGESPFAPRPGGSRFAPSDERTSDPSEAPAQRVGRRFADSTPQAAPASSPSTAPAFSQEAASGAAPAPAPAPTSHAAPGSPAVSGSPAAPGSPTTPASPVKPVAASSQKPGEPREYVLNISGDRVSRTQNPEFVSRSTPPQAPVPEVSVDYPTTVTSARHSATASPTPEEAAQDSGDAPSMRIGEPAVLPARVGESQWSFTAPPSALDLAQMGQTIANSGSFGVGLPLSDVNELTDLEKTMGVRPAGSVRLVFDDGTRYDLVGTLLIGRDPVAEGPFADAAVLAVSDQARSVSKAHVVVRVRDGQVFIEDLHSTNGTKVSLADGGITRVIPGVETPIAPGVMVIFGRRRMLVSG